MGGGPCPSVAERLRLFREVCAAVAFAHRNLVVHRDLTPSNVLVTKGGSAKLIDFGIARPANGMPDRSEKPSLASLSLTPGYAAPERMASTQVTTAADIYSLGRLLTKLIPDDKDRELAAIVARDYRRPARPSSHRRRAGRRRAGLGGRLSGRCHERRAALRRGQVRRAPLPGLRAGGAAMLLLVGALTVTLLANARAERARAESDRRFQQTRAIASTLLFETFDEVSRTQGWSRRCRLVEDRRRVET